jgi:murein DD-endopeptidase MepM/ murein hydrolase activator NlpD
MHPAPPRAQPLPPRVTRVVRCALATALVALAAFLAPPAAARRPAPASGVWPLQPRPPVVTGFDPPATRYGRGHRGVDLLGHVGEAVHTSLGGRVSFAGSLAGRGVVVVDHGSTRTTYQPVAAAVHVGDQVARGEVIGRLLLVGSHCFPRACLHWGLIEGRDHYLDPLVLVGAVPVRLLPLDGASSAFGGGSLLGAPLLDAPLLAGRPVGAAVLPAPRLPAPRLPAPRLPAPDLPVSTLGPLGVPGRLGLPGP